MDINLAELKTIDSEKYIIEDPKTKDIIADIEDASLASIDFESEIDRLLDGTPVGDMVMVEVGDRDYQLVKLVFTDDSTPANPVIAREDGSYRVEINSVNPENATEWEMAAYLMYVDSEGLGINVPFGSYSEFKTLRVMDDYEKSKNIQAPTFDMLTTVRRNWLRISNEYLFKLWDDKQKFIYHTKINNALNHRALKFAF